VPTHPLWRPYELTDLDEVAKVRVGGPSRPVEVVPYDAAWPAAYERVATRIRDALGDRIVSLDHVGSTSVPGLAAKPIIDVNLVVADSGDESAYLPDLEAVGFTVRVREPDWEEHRVLATTDPEANLHVFSPGSPETGRVVMFRDWLRTHPADRDEYGALKTELARRGGFTEVMDYNNHKAALVYDIYEKAFTADPAHEHDPRPRPDGT
jgi:GrpB-like predicted nucleotidyltransferase (UPF0157 family)